MKKNLHAKVLGLVLGLSLTGGAGAAVLAQSATSDGQTPRPDQQKQTMRQNNNVQDKSDTPKKMGMQEMMNHCMRMMKMMKNMNMENGPMMKMDGNADRQKNTAPQPNKRQ